MRFVSIVLCFAALVPLPACASRDRDADGGSDAITTSDATPDEGLASADGGVPDTAPDATVCRSTGPRPVLDLRYHSEAGVDADLLSLDLYLPTLPAGCAPPPLVVYVHGGAWVTGDKRNQIETKVSYFTGEGYAFASVNYRLAPSETRPAGVRYPVHPQDVARALAFLRDRAGTYGYRAERITLFGHSAGGGIVTLVGTDPQFLTGAGRTFADLSCVAVLDTESFDVAGQIAMGGQTEMVYRNAFGDDASVWARASPLRNDTLVAGRGISPFMVVTRGQPNRQALAQRFADALRAAGVTVTYTVAASLSHEGVNDAIGDRSDAVVMPTFGPFVARCARGG